MNHKFQKIIEQAKREGWLQLYIHVEKLSFILEGIFDLENLEMLVVTNSDSGMVYGARTEDMHFIGANENIFADYKTFLSPEMKEIFRLKTIGKAKIHTLDIPLEKIPQKIEEIKSLRTLVILVKPGKNHVTTLSANIGKLAKLEHFSLTDGKITKLPLEIVKLHRLRDLDLRGNPLPIPPEILQKVDLPGVILDYYFTHLHVPKKSLNELKLIIIGQGSVGKTSLVQQILLGTFDQNQTKTEGISINQWALVESQSEI